MEAAKERKEEALDKEKEIAILYATLAHGGLSCTDTGRVAN